MDIDAAFGIFGSVGQYQLLLENEINISIQLVSRKQHDALECSTRTKENPADQNSVCGTGTRDLEVAVLS